MAERLLAKEKVAGSSPVRRSKQNMLKHSEAFEIQSSTEIPDNFVPVQVSIEKTNLREVLATGLAANKGGAFGKHIEQEEIAEQTRLKLGVEPSRRNCIFAYPMSSGKEDRPFKSGDNCVTLTVYVDPEKCWVVDAEFYTYLSENVILGDPEKAKQFARYYWESRVKLSDYMAGNYNHRFMYPEVLIQQHHIESKFIKIGS